jgi:hypothetical protein
MGTSLIFHFYIAQINISLHMPLKVLLYCLITLLYCQYAYSQGFAMPNKPTKGKGKPASIVKPILPKEVYGIDTFIQKVSVITQASHAEVQKYLLFIDELDGYNDSVVKNFKDPNTDAIITHKILNQAQLCSVYIENETWEVSPTLNQNIKKRYLGLLAKCLLEYWTTATTVGGNIEKRQNDVIRLHEMLYALKMNRLPEYVMQHLDASTYKHISQINTDSMVYHNFLNELSGQSPELLANLPLKQLSKYKGFCKVMEATATTAANKILNLSTSTGEERTIIRQCSSTLIQKIIAIGDSTQYYLKAISFLDDYAAGNKTIDDLNAITQDSIKYFDALIDAYLKGNISSANVIKRDLELVANNYVRIVNELHSQNDNIRFKCTEKLSARQLYYLCVLSNQEIYTSSYLGIYKRMMDKMKEQDGFTFLQNIQFNQFRTFIRMCANYNTLDNFLKSMQGTYKNKLMDNFVSGLGTQSIIDLEGAINVADSFGSIGDTSLIKFLSNKVDSTLQVHINTGNKGAIKAYEILKNIALAVQGIDTSNAFSQRYQIPPLTKVPLNTLQPDSNDKVYELMYFYGDDDGKVGFNNFMGGFDASKWHIDNSNYNWVVISSKGGKVPIEIYANKPHAEPQDEQAQHALMQYLYKANIQPTIVVHRGHSYHLDATIDAMSYHNKIIILGSCGGYQNLNKIINRSPNAHIISTKQVGAFGVNTPIINALHNTINTGNDVQWIPMWHKLQQYFNSNVKYKALFNDYVPPHRNMGALFIKAYNAI